MTPDERTALLEHNAEQLAQMSRGAAGMVKSFLHELERKGRNTYIRLHDPAPGGHTVSYVFLEGDEGLLSRVGTALGVAVTDSQLEVPGGA